MRTRRGLLGLLAGGALALLAGRWVAGRLADRAFLDALGYGELWLLRGTSSALLASLAFLAAGAFAFANLFAVRQSIVSLVLPRQLGDLEIPEAVPTRRLTFAAAALALIVALVFALLPQDWSTALLAWDGVAFGEVEPYLERDLGFYVTWLPWERALQARATVLLVTVGVLVLLAYGATPSIRWGANGLYVSTWVRRHLAVLTGLVVLVIGWDWRLDRYERLSDGSAMWLASATDAHFSIFDHRIALPYLAIVSFASLPIAAVLMWAGWRGYLRLAASMLGALIVLGPVASTLLPLLARGPLSAPGAAERERSYRSVADIYTRRAYGVDLVAGADTSELAVVPLRVVPRAVSGWDPSALRPRADSAEWVAWRGEPAGLEAWTLARARDDEDGRWRLRGFLASSADDAGRPYSSPTVSAEQLGAAWVHPGAGRYALVADASGRIAAPTFASTLQRLVLSWDLQDPRLALRDVPQPRPRLITHRDVRERLQAVVPFLHVGSSITPHLRGDSLYWFADLFVTANRYPLSKALVLDGRAVHYARHAAMAVVQAQTGEVWLVPADQPDPVLQAWLRRLPDLFTPLTALPAWVRDERPPAVDLLGVQATALALSGFQGDTVGRLRVARPDDADPELATGAPVPFAFGPDAALGWALTVDAPTGGPTQGLLVARGGAARRTEFHRWIGPRWTGVLEELQHAADSAGFGRATRGAMRGQVRVVPSDSGPLWVQTHYARADDGAPRVTGVSVLLGERARAGRSLPEAFGLPRPAAALGADAFRARVAQLYDAMRQAQRVGDWRAYADAWESLGRLLGRP